MRHTYLFLLTAITFLGFFTTACAQKSDDAGAMNTETSAASQETSSNAVEQNETWVYSWTPDNPEYAGQAEVNLVAETDELLDFQSDYDYKGEQGEIRIRAMRLSTEFDYYNGQQLVDPRSGDDRSYPVTLKMISNACYAGYNVDMETGSETKMLLHPKGVEC